jgi:hypothetical protein
MFWVVGWGLDGVWALLFGLFLEDSSLVCFDLEMEYNHYSAL